MSDSISIPGYRIVRKLGQGGMASVHLAIQESFDREVALKVMSPFLNSDPSFATRFLREARIVAQIHHSSIVPVMDVGQHGGHHYLSMEYLPGGDLKQRIVEGRHGPNLALNVCVAISAALDLAHRKGFVHRDIKPENILFREDGAPVLTDFGIARAIDAGTQLTMAGTMVGTPSYMSPEQVKGAELDGRSDLYSLGVVFYEMLTGLLPFRADSTMTLAMKHLTEPLPLLPPQFAIYQPFLDRLMAKEREDRFASGAEVIRALRLITDMAIARESTVVRNRGAQAGGTEMQTLVAPTTGSMGVPPSAAQGTVRIPSTTTQPSGVMQIPSLAAQPSGVHAAPTVQLAPPAETLVAPVDTLALPPVATLVAASPVATDSEDLTVPRPASQKPPPALSGQPAKAKPAAPKVPGVPLQVRARALAQKLSGSKHSTWAAAAVIGLVAIGTGYLLGKTTDAEVPSAPLASNTAPIAETRVALAMPPVEEIVPAGDVIEGDGSTDPGSAGLSASTDTDGSTMPPEVEPQRMPVQPQPEVAPSTGRSNPGLTAGITAPPAVEGEKPATTKPKSKQEILAERKKIAEELAAQQRLRNAEAERARLERIVWLLKEAKADIAKGALVSPANENAVDRYREVLGKEPSPAQAEEARNGLKRVAAILVQEADRALANGSARALAGQLIDSLRMVQPDHPELSRLQDRLNEAEGAGSKRLAGRNLANFNRAMDRIDSALKRSPQTLGTVKDAAREYDKAQVISNVASGMSIRRAQIEEAFAGAFRYEMEKGNAKNAREIIAIARSRDWLTPELMELEKSMNATPSP